MVVSKTEIYKRANILPTIVCITLLSNNSIHNNNSPLNKIYSILLNKRTSPTQTNNNSSAINFIFLLFLNLKSKKILRKEKHENNLKKNMVKNLLN